jgi:hypothetical protein
MKTYKFKAVPLNTKIHGDAVEGSLLRISETRAVIIPFNYIEDKVKTILYKDFDSYEDVEPWIYSIDTDCIEVDIETICLEEESEKK